MHVSHWRVALECQLAQFAADALHPGENASSIGLGQELE
jgi:hypothetical protein